MQFELQMIRSNDSPSYSPCEAMLGHTHRWQDYRSLELIRRVETSLYADWMFFFVSQELVSINPAKAAELVLGHFISELEPIITALQVSVHTAYHR